MCQTTGKSLKQTLDPVWESRVYSAQSMLYTPESGSTKPCAYTFTIILGNSRLPGNAAPFSRQGAFQTDSKVCGMKTRKMLHLIVVIAEFWVSSLRLSWSRTSTTERRNSAKEVKNGNGPCTVSLRLSDGSGCQPVRPFWKEISHGVCLSSLQ